MLQHWAISTKSTNFVHNFASDAICVAKYLLRNMGL